MILTNRLMLVPATVQLMVAEMNGRAALAQGLGAEVPESWPPEFHDMAALTHTLWQLRRHPQEAGWWLHYFVRREEEGAPRLLIGAGGYKGAPDAEGTVEIGYSILPEYRRQGFATEATRGLIAHAFRRSEVKQVVAETLPELYPSIGVLKKCGFSLEGPGSEEGAIRYRLTRQAYEQGKGLSPPEGGEGLLQSCNSTCE